MTAAVSRQDALTMDATRLNQMKRDSVPEIMAASMVGTGIEFYDFYCYGVAAASYFPTVFFPEQTPFIALMSTMLTFAIAFLSRPFGSLLFGHFGDKWGRKRTLVTALMLMGCSTFLVGCLPGYAQIGVWSVVLLCLCRVCQGIGLAGEWSGAALVATENAPANKRALYGSFPNLGAPAGFFCCYGLNLILQNVLTKDQMLAYGWRIPFLLSAVLVAVGLYVRSKMQETPVYRLAEAENRTSKSPVRDLLPYWRQVLQGTFAMGVTYTLFWLLGTWSLSYGVKTLKYSNSEWLVMELVAILFFAGFIVLGCLWSDRFGRKKVLMAFTVATLVFSLFATSMLTANNVPGVMFFLCGGFLLMGGLFGPVGAFLPELFPMNVRYTGAGLSYNLAAIVGAAFAPSIATYLAQNYSVTAVGWYMAVMAVLSVVALLTAKDGSNLDYTK
ncbi:MFS transporter [Bifidobacterium sp. DSM 109958]|uniref:Putative proline/betaine transporter n=1 Tax=Bifidobacterium moraviense TaxID=2675323 RepID=A0A7Y0F126_9BIFI|nr:MFS transporter [Bifidobacterium sp. DSM 109958]NMN00065.1 MFS transporter [Bifidobacterium sp. DSM 109958]